jgi:formyltetrahydrofolate synthetase
METPIMTNLTTLRITRSLDSSSSLPLVSTISTDNVTTDFNGTMITCSGMSIMTGLLATENVELILIGIQNIRSKINNGRFVLTTLVLFMKLYYYHTVAPSANISKQSQSKDISVTLEWTHTNGVSYNVSVDPEVAVNHTGRNSAQFIVSYDTKYNVSVVASLCGVTMTYFTIIYHGM